MIIKKNGQKFAVLKKYNLPIGKFVIGGSGSLGIRGIREINDIDILVSDDLIYFKRKMNRPKDLEDIKLIEKWLRNKVNWQEDP